MWSWVQAPPAVRVEMGTAKSATLQTLPCKAINRQPTALYQEDEGHLGNMSLLKEDESVLRKHVNDQEAQIDKAGSPKSALPTYLPRQPSFLD